MSSKIWISRPGRSYGFPGARPHCTQKPRTPRESASLITLCYCIPNTYIRFMVSQSKFKVSLIQISELGNPKFGFPNVSIENASANAILCMAKGRTLSMFLSTAPRRVGVLRGLRCRVRLHPQQTHLYAQASTKLFR